MNKNASCASMETRVWLSSLHEEERGQKGQLGASQPGQNGDVQVAHVLSQGEKEAWCPLTSLGVHMGMCAPTSPPHISFCFQSLEFCFCHIGLNG